MSCGVVEMWTRHLERRSTTIAANGRQPDRPSLFVPQRQDSIHRLPIWQSDAVVGLVTKLRLEKAPVYHR